ncbi:MAG: helix-turn-helix domain-containing protein [Burkholderiales bacterium]|nr:helix-turn-helix domain-containing protein [Burkholderiales bacterium]
MKLSVGLPLREVARRTGLSLPTIRRYVRSGKIPAAMEPGPFGMQWEVSEEELERLYPGTDQVVDGYDHNDPDQGGCSIQQECDHTHCSPDQPHGSDQPSDHSDQCGIPGSEPGAGRPTPDSVLREEVAYWRGRWEELRDVMTHLSQSMESYRKAALEEDESESSKEELRRRSQELAQARNLVDRLRAEKARLEEEVQALRERLRSAEPTLSDGVSVPVRMRLEERRR